MTFETDNSNLNATGAVDIPAQLSSANDPKDGGELMTDKKVVSEAVRQKNYVDAMKAEGFEVGLVYARSFMEGMRDLGYKNPGWAIAELCDNGIQASASQIEVSFEFADKSDKKPTAIAIIDNGVGMIPEMISYAVRWGGSVRLNDRTGLGRFGYGLPSSSISMGRVYTVYSKSSGGEWHNVRVSIDDLAEAAGQPGETERLLEPRPGEPPAWIAVEPFAGSTCPVGELDSGTVIVIEDLDRLPPGWVMAKPLKDKLVKHFGEIYRKTLSDCAIVVDGTTCEPIDPLFLDPACRFYSENSVSAIEAVNRVISVETPSGRRGDVIIRASILPPNFGLKDPDNPSQKADKKNGNQRFSVFGRGDLNGFIVLRAGRQIDVVQPSWTKFQNYDNYIKIELDFDPELDEMFSVTTSKQQIRFTEDLTAKLMSPGAEGGQLVSLVKDMREEFKALNYQWALLKAAAKAKIVTQLPSGAAMEQAERVTGKRKVQTEADAETADKNKALEITEKVKATGADRAKIEEQVEARIKARKWDIEPKVIPDGVFYVPKRLGEQRRIHLNVEHPFYKVFEQNPEAQSALELLLFVLAKGEFDSGEEKRKFYENERLYWSQMLRVGLDALNDPQDYIDKQSSIMESIESAEELAPDSD